VDCKDRSAQKTNRSQRPTKVQQLARHAAQSVSAAEREIWSARDIMLRWNISEVTFWRYRRKGYLPTPDAKIGPHHAWYRNTILAIEGGHVAVAD
jgi:hypothetical protein